MFVERGFLYSCSVDLSVWTRCGISLATLDDEVAALIDFAEETLKHPIAGYLDHSDELHVTLLFETASDRATVEAELIAALLWERNRHASK